jgi:hypothetical protein
MYYSLSDILALHPKGISTHNKGIILTSYQNRYYKIQPNILWGCCKYQNNYIVHMRIPSESDYCRNVFYDVVFEFYPTRASDKDGGNFGNYGVLVYTNSIQFTYTYTYAYNKYGLIIPWLKSKCMNKCLTVPAVQKNPDHTIGVDINMWFAAYHMKLVGILDKRKFDLNINTSQSHIAKVVYSQSYMAQLRSDAETIGRLAEKNMKQAKDASKAKENEYRATKHLEKLVKEHIQHTTRQPVNAHAVAHSIIKKAKTPKIARLARQARKPK